MKRRRLVLSPPLLPTIIETLEDFPPHPSSSQSSPSSQSLEDYMISIQALARPVEAPSHGVVRLQRTPRLRHFSKAPMKLSVSASLPRASPRTLRTSRPYNVSLNTTEEISLKMGRDKDPVDWLFGQIRTWTETLLLRKAPWWSISQSNNDGNNALWLLWLLRKEKIYLFLWIQVSKFTLFIIL